MRSGRATRLSTPHCGSQEHEERPADDPKKVRSVFNDLFGDVPPNSARVLGRVLLAQSAFMHVLIDMQAHDASDVPKAVPPVSSDEIKWRCMTSEDVKAAEIYVQGRLYYVRGHLVTHQQRRNNLEVRPSSPAH